MMTSGAMWQGEVGRAWAAEAELTDRSFVPVTRALLDRIAGIAATEVLDIGCGAGELSLAVARTHPAARVAGLDISPDLVAAARSRARAAGLAARVDFQLGDAGADQPPFAADLIVSRHGVMFFADPVAAFAHLRTTAQPAARLVFSCFRAEGDNRWAADMAALLGSAPVAPPPGAFPPPGPFAFADPAHVRGVLEQAGWRDVVLEPLDYAYVAGAGDDPVGEAMAFFRRIGPAARALREVDDAARPELEARIRAWLEHSRAGERVSFPAAVWIVSARAA